MRHMNIKRAVEQGELLYRRSADVALSFVSLFNVTYPWKLHFLLFLISETDLFE